MTGTADPTGATASTDHPLAITEGPVPVPAWVGRVHLAEFRACYGDALAAIGKLESARDDERKEARKATAGFLRDLVGTADAIDRVVALPGTDPAHRAALVGVRKLLARALTRQGVVRPRLVGAIADPELVDLEDSRPDDSLPDETVVEELVAAYTWNGTVLRRGKVVVSHHSRRA